MSNLSYKGIAVNVDANGTFRAEVRGEFVESETLKELHTLIDAELSRTTPRMSLQIVAIDRGKVIAAKLIGVSRTDSSPRFADKAVAPNVDTILADTPANRDLLERFEAARISYEGLRKAVSDRRAYVRGYGRITAGEYDRKLATIEQMHKASLAAGEAERSQFE